MRQRKDRWAERINRRRNLGSRRTMRGRREGGEGEKGGGEEKTMPGQEAKHLPPVSSENKIFRRKSKNPHGKR